MELLRVEHLSRYYGEGPAQVKALDDVYGYRAPIFTNWTRTHWPFFDGAR